jgi:hypothetical protein
MSDETGIHGRLRGYDGRPVREATLTVVDGAGHQISRSLATDGQYHVALTPGRYTLLVSAPGSYPQARNVVVGVQPTRLDVAMGAASGLSGTVLAPEADQPSTVTVTLLDRAGNSVRRTATTPGGSYSFEDLDPDMYTVVAAGEASSTREVRVADGAMARQDLRLS